jgi:hypothetical protein
MKTAIDVLIEMGFVDTKNGNLLPLSKIEIEQAMKEFAKHAVTVQRDLMARHLNMRNVPTPWSEK